MSIPDEELHNCLIDRVNVSMTGRFPSTVNGTTIRTSPALAIARAFLFPKISVGGSERPGAGTFRSDAPDAYTLPIRSGETAALSSMRPVRVGAGIWDGFSTRSRGVWDSSERPAGGTFSDYCHQDERHANACANHDQPDTRGCVSLHSWSLYVQ
jgi:hypothetical protein